MKEQGTALHCTEILMAQTRFGWQAWSWDRGRVDEFPRLTSSCLFCVWVGGCLLPLLCRPVAAHPSGRVWTRSVGWAKTTSMPRSAPPCTMLLLLKGIAHEIMSDSEKEGRQDAWGGWSKRGVQLRVPKQRMLACYPGRGVRQAHNHTHTNGLGGRGRRLALELARVLT